MGRSSWPQALTHTFTDPETGHRYTHREDISHLPGGIGHIHVPETAAAMLEEARHEVATRLAPLRPRLTWEQWDRLDCAINDQAGATGEFFISHVVAALQAARGWSDGIWLVEEASPAAARARLVRRREERLHLWARLILAGYLLALTVGLLIGWLVWGGRRHGR